MSLNNRDAIVAYRVVEEVLRERRRYGVPIPAWLRDYHLRTETQFFAVSRSRQRGAENASPSEQSDEMTVPITARQVAAMTGLSKRQVLRHAHELQGSFVDGRWQFHRSAVTAWIEERSTRVGQ